MSFLHLLGEKSITNLLCTVDIFSTKLNKLVTYRYYKIIIHKVTIAPKAGVYCIKRFVKLNAITKFALCTQLYEIVFVI